MIWMKLFQIWLSLKMNLKGIELIVSELLFTIMIKENDVYGKMKVQSFAM